jgi:signal transduction histidine kinase
MLPPDELGLFDTPPDPQQVRFSLAIVGLLMVFVLVALPAHDVRLGEVPAFIPILNAIMFVGELITAALLYAQATVFRSRALTVLGTGYLLCALLIVPHTLTFPGAFAPNGLLGAGLNTTAWLATSRRVAFPIAVILYVRLKRAESTEQYATDRPAAGIVAGLLVALALAAGTTVLTTIGHDLLPSIFLNRDNLNRGNFILCELVTSAICVTATIYLFRRRTSVLDMWLLVALAGWIAFSILNITLHTRFTVGFYCVYTLSLFSHLIVMLALIVESNRLYARLALSTSAWKRERETRLMSIDALAAAISHEVGQPLAAIGILARASQAWLSRERPDVERAVRSLDDIIDAEVQTAAIIKSIRATLTTQPGARTEFSFNDLVRATASSLVRDLDSEGVLLEFALDESLPPVLADQVQMQRVLANLLTNSIESLAATRGRPRRIAIRSAPADHLGVLIEVSDNGVGIASGETEHIFEAFFTTKATGTGLGLSLCRAIVEAHGGRLWASQHDHHGATFHLRLPGGSTGG